MLKMGPTRTDERVVRPVDLVQRERRPVARAPEHPDHEVAAELRRVVPLVPERAAHAEAHDRVVPRHEVEAHVVHLEAPVRDRHRQVARLALLLAREVRLLPVELVQLQPVADVRLVDRYEHVVLARRVPRAREVRREQARRRHHRLHTHTLTSI